MSEVRVRLARLGDAPAIAAIHVRTWQDAYRELLPATLLAGLDVADRTRMWERMLASHLPRTATLVAEDGGTVVGFCSVGGARLPGADGPETDATGEIYAIYVWPDAQGMGVGAALMTAAFETLRGDTFARAILWVLAGNAPAIAFYERMGWQADGATKREEIGGVAIEEFRYWRSLGPAETKVEVDR
ncbi:MAG: GNAT family N-acetyltransferase [Thermomicrobiales bacterium]